MKALVTSITVFSLFFVFSPFTNGQEIKCGVERWDVKTLSDPDTTKVDFDNIVNTTVKEQKALPRPEKVWDMPRMESETTVYKLKGYIVQYKKEDDRDFHVVFTSEDFQDTMVVEIISPECPEVQKTSRIEQIRYVHNVFVLNFNPKKYFKKLKNPELVEITGVGFFDHLHNQRGMAKNGREIHPILSINYLNEE